MKYPDTEEQKAIINHILTKDGILLVKAGAGNGKTYLAERAIQELKPKSCLYTAFNKAIVEEGRAKFDKYGVSAKTLHALAYQYVKPKKEIQDITYSCITENVTYREKYTIIQAINDFFISSSSDMYKFMEDFFVDEPDHYRELAVLYVNKMIDGEINPSFSFLLKFFHLMLLEGTIDLKYDLVILDEINDTTGVALEIFKLINAPKKLGLGETHQAIYSFMNLVDGFEELSDSPRLPLTQSFRCSVSTASKLQKFMRTHVTNDFTFVGTENPVANELTLYCTRTNSQIIDHIVSRQKARRGYALLRKPSEIFACPLAVMSASSGKKVYQRKYKFLETEYINFKDSEAKTYFSYLLDNVDDKEIHSAITLLVNLSKQNINLFEVYKKAKDNVDDHTCTIATVFTAKGLEFENVYIANDLNSSIQKIIEAGGISNDDDLAEFRCYYVACSRAGKNLYGALHLN